MSSSYADLLLDWFDRHGRHDLPWQKNPTMYRVWVSEIMLQQTRVATVIPYYREFMRRFPTLKSLAQAPLDDVLGHWAGLGYYSRARNLHRAACEISEHHRGRFPRDFDTLVSLPGIGRSTAGAILAQALGQRHAILDGNVKRVLARYCGIEGWTGAASVQALLWERAQVLLPDERLADYTQASMDLGATLCTRSSPRCGECPLQSDCVAWKTGRVAELPTPRPRRDLPVKAVRMLLVTNEAGAVLLEKRPPAGIWGGLWSLPEASPEERVDEVCRQRWGLDVAGETDSSAFRHSFSHYHLDIMPCRVQLRPGQYDRILDGDRIDWCLPRQASDRALAAPVARILKEADIQAEA